MSKIGPDHIYVNTYAIYVRLNELREIAPKGQFLVIESDLGGKVVGGRFDGWSVTSQPTSPGIRKASPLEALAACGMEPL